MTRVLLLDGTEVSPDAPLLRADDLGMVRGEAVFETLRVVHGTPVQLAAHLSRMAQSAARLDMQLPSGFAELAAKAAVGATDAGLRLTFTKGGLGYAVLFDVAPETVAARSGISVMTLPLGISSTIRAEQPWLLGGVKSTSYAVNMAALRHAHAHGADDVIWVSTDGYVLEAPTSTVIAKVDGGWVTPPAETGILPGTTLLAVQQITQVAVRQLAVEELTAEVCLLSSVRGVAPVTALDGRQLPVDHALGAAFEASLRG